MLDVSNLSILLLGGLFVTFTTSIGSFLTVFFRRLPDWGLEFSMAFSGGVMIVASFTSLIIPAINLGGILMTSLGIVSGFVLIYFVERYVPHEHILGDYEGPEDYKGRIGKIWLIAIAIFIHNFPEGLAVGVSLVNDLSKGIITTIAIGIQDIPEGLAVSLPIAIATRRLWMPIFIGVLSGLSEFLTAVIGGLAFSLFSPLLPFGLGLAGGAMVYVVIKEVMPEVYTHENERLMTFGFMLGFLAMLILDSSLG